MKELIEGIDRDMFQVKQQRLKYEKQYGVNKSIKGISEPFNPRFKKLNAKLEQIDYIGYLHSIEKKDMSEITARIREIAILQNERKYRAYDY